MINGRGLLAGIILIGASLAAHDTFAKEITLTCKSTLYTVEPSRGVQAPPMDKDPVTFTFDLENKRVTFLEGDAYTLDSVTPSLITWRDGDAITYTFNRDTLTGTEVSRYGASSLNYVFAPCKLMTHKF